MVREGFRAASVILPEPPRRWAPAGRPRDVNIVRHPWGAPPRPPASRPLRTIGMRLSSHVLRSAVLPFFARSRPNQRNVQNVA